MKRKSLILALVLAVAISGGVYAYTYTTATATIGFTVAGLEIATVEPAPEEDQPDWESVLPAPGAEGAETLRPNAAGNWLAPPIPLPHQHPSSGEHWDKVDDVVADDWDTYVYSGGTWHGDLYNIPDHTEGSGTINGITVYFRFAGDQHGPQDDIGYAKALIYTHGTVYEGSEEVQAGLTFVDKLHEWETNPYTGEAWTWSEIDALQIGISLKGKTEARFAYCTQVYVEVDCEEAPVTEGEVPEGYLFVVTPHPAYTGDLQVKVYLTNTGALVKAYQYLNMKLYLEGSIEAGETPDYQLLTLQNGEVAFNLEAPYDPSHILEVIGGSYCLVSEDPPEDYITPEFYSEVTQR